MSSSPDLTRRPRTRRTLSEADMVRMRDLYYDRDIPLTRVADAFSVPVSTFLRWIAEMDWPRRSAWSPEVAGAASPPPRPSPVSRERGKTADVAEKRLDMESLAFDVAAAARMELATLGDVAGPMSLDERRRRADIIASLSRSIARIDRTFESKMEREKLKAEVREARARENSDAAQAQKLLLGAITEQVQRIVKQPR